MPKKKNGRYRYTDDYKTVSRVDEKGKKRHHLIYTGKWFLVMNGADEYHKTVRRVQAASLVSLAAVIVALLILPVPVNDKWYLVPLVISLFPLSYLAMGAVMLPQQVEPMESARYHRSILRVMQSSTLCFAALAASAAGLVVYWILAAAGKIGSATQYTIRDAVFAACLILTACFCLLIRNMMKRIRIEERENGEIPPPQEGNISKD